MSAADTLLAAPFATALRAVLDPLPQGLMVFDAGLRLIAANRRLAQVLDEVDRARAESAAALAEVAA